MITPQTHRAIVRVQITDDYLPEHIINEDIETFNPVWWTYPWCLLLWPFVLPTRIQSSARVFRLMVSLSFHPLKRDAVNIPWQYRQEDYNLFLFHAPHKERKRTSPFFIKESVRWKPNIPGIRAAVVFMGAKAGATKEWMESLEIGAIQP